MRPQTNQSSIVDKRVSKEIKGVIPKDRQDVLKWYGWGYKDARFSFKNNSITFEGDKYILGGQSLPHFTKWVEDQFNFKITDVERYPKIPTDYPAPRVNEAFIESLRKTNIAFSDKGVDRLIRCHGQTLHDIYYLWTNSYERIPDLVVWPKSHDDVVSLVNLANEHNVAVIPYGGGTSVSGSITCPQNENRMIMVVDMLQMNKMLWLDRENLTVCFESGVVGQDLERTLQSYGLTVGHEPDSYEFSTLGGWVATRASGMKKNAYGNIEDLVVRVKMVTTKGVLERDCSAPRVSCGPDMNHVILGSEGTLGIVTEVVLKVRPLPPIKKYGSLIFPDFDSGVKFMREVARRRCQPASVRLMDNEQFRFGQSLKPLSSWYKSALDKIKQAYVTKIKGYDLSMACAATLLFEGEAEDIQRQENVIFEIAKIFKGIPAGSTNGERGYILTFVIAYIRDFALNHHIVAESFETSVPWDRCELLCRNVKYKVKSECAARNINYFLISCRVTQTYDAGCCVYFYFGFKYDGIKDPVATYEAIENAARDEILACGGSLSHHHGVGKIRSKWYPRVVSEPGVALYKAAKQELDPKNIFAAGNLLPIEDNHHKAKL